MLDGTFDLYLDGAQGAATAPEIWCTHAEGPAARAAAYYNKQDKPRAQLFSVSPARRLRELFDRLHNLTDPQEVVAALADQG